MIWRGQATEAFATLWRSKNAPEIRVAEEALRTAAETIRRNWEAQQTTSDTLYRSEVVPTVFDPLGVRKQMLQDREGANEQFWQTPIDTLPTQGRHNTYLTRTIEQALAEGDTVLELDIHPTKGTADWIPIHGNRLEGDWDVRHTAIEDSEVDTLREGLRDLRRVDPQEPTFLTLDVRGELNKEHDSKALDSLFVEELGSSRIYTPDDLKKWAESETGQSFSNPKQAVAAAGFPPAEELRGRTMLILTDHHAEGYTGDQAFGSYKPLSGDGDPNALFYNVPEQETTDAQIQAWRDQGKIVRTYPPGEVLGTNVDEVLRNPADAVTDASLSATLGPRYAFNHPDGPDLDAQNIDTFD